MSLWRALSRYAVEQVRARAGHLAYNNPLYNWSLGGGVPDHFDVIPADMWPGDAGRGRDLCAQDFYFLEGDPAGHDFAFLRDVRALGGDQARRFVRDAVGLWLADHAQWDPVSWRADVLGQRLTHWISFYEFFGASADDDFQDEFFDSLARQARHLCRVLPDSPMAGLPLLRAVRGLIYAGLSCAGQEDWLRRGLDVLEREAGRQVLADGCHISRSPAQLLEALMVFLDVRNGMLGAAYPVPAALEDVISRMAQALRFLRYADKGLALFYGAQEGDVALIDTVLAHVATKGRIPLSLPHGGYERLALGRSVLMIDSGTPPVSPYDLDAHAAPLAFEFIYGKERIFVNCGAHPSDAAWKDALRGTAAHNALGIDYRNICEIAADGHFMRKPRKVTVVREETSGALLLEGSHDGYVPLNGITHRRRFYLGHQGHDVRGEENLTCSVGLSKPVDIAIRFHLHPRVQVSLIRDGQEALLRLPGGAGWRFFHSAGDLTLENSIYLGEGTRPRKTKQLVISGTMNEDYGQIKWALQREGL